MVARSRRRSFRFPPPRALALLGLAAATVTSLVSSGEAAAADEVIGTRSGERLYERAHSIHARVDHGVATLRVRRTFRNEGPRHDQAEVWIEPPARAVATGLRTRGRQNGRDVWFAGELMEAGAARSRYRELTGFGEAFPRDPALLAWRSSEVLTLQVFPVAPRADKEIEYTLALPTTYEDGRYRVTLPRTGTDELAAGYTIEPVHRGDRIEVNGASLRPGRVYTPEFDGLSIELERRDAPAIEGRLGVVPFADDRVLMHFDLDIGPALSTVPDHARVVVLVDTSRSRSRSVARASLSAARAYLAHFEGTRGSKAAVVTFDRRVAAQTRGFVPIERAREQIATARRAVKPGNGSAVDDALAEAERLLAKAPKGAPRRVVLISDFLVRSSLTERRARTLARRTGAVVHLAELRVGSAYLDRRDDDAWARVASDTGGVRWSAYAEEAPLATNRAHLRVFEEWARPLRIDNAGAYTNGDSEQDLDLSYTLDEGVGVTRFDIVTSQVRHVTLYGELWSEPVREVFLPDAGEGDRWAGLVFGSELLSSLKREEMLALAVRGGVVSPVTSYLAIEPGVRPSTEGLDWGEGTIGLGSTGLIGKGGGGGSGGSYGRRSFNPKEYLSKQLTRAWRACGGGSRAATVTLETTYTEVVDVPEVTASGATATLRECLSEGAWALDLPYGFKKQFARWTVPVGG